jgi:hypothetical protein
MTHKQRTSVCYDEEARTHKALRQRIEMDLAQLKRCQQDEHAMQATQSPGVVVCTLCRSVGVCLWCGIVPPQGASIVPCRVHAHLASIDAARTALSIMPTNGKEQQSYGIG